MSKDLLKEAIADAKAVRETAIANAKLALEEAFTPKLQSMLSAKIQEEEELEETELADEDTAPNAEEMAMADETTDLAAENEDTEEAAEPAEEMAYGEGEEVEEGEDTEEGIKEDEEVEETEDVEEDAELEEIIKELEEEDDEVSEEETTDEAEDVEEAEEVEEDEDMDESLDLDEVIKSLQEEEMEEEEVEEVDELEEAYKTIRSLKATINEVNLLNAKLLFSNKLFRSNDLNESQKMKVIETFDRAGSVREVKLVYTTLAESLTAYTPSRKKRVTEGFASKTSKSTAPKKGVIVESNDFANRMKKLAGLL